MRCEHGKEQHSKNFSLMKQKQVGKKKCDALYCSCKKFKPVMDLEGLKVFNQAVKELLDD